MSVIRDGLECTLDYCPKSPLGEFSDVTSTFNALHVDAGFAELAMRAYFAGLVTGLKLQNQINTPFVIQPAGD